MSKIFNTAAVCIPEKHYMVDLTERINKIKSLIEEGNYFTINRARQYGKTTILRALSRYLQKDYYVILLDFQTFGNAEFKSENTFSISFAGSFFRLLKRVSPVMTNKLAKSLSELQKNIDNRNEFFALKSLFEILSDICESVDKPIVLMIDEVDNAADNQVFLDFLAQLRAYYIDRDIQATFQSVILAGVHDIKNMKRKIRPEDEHKLNSPWNIATEFNVEMSFSKNEIIGMLLEYEADYHTGMNIEEIASLLYDYTSGYPYLVSRICKLIDERIAGTAAYPDKAGAWTEEGYLAAVKMLLEENNPLFDSLINKINQYPELKSVIWRQLFQGQPVAYAADDSAVRNARMFGLVKTENGSVRIANRIFETRLYNYFLTLPEVQGGELYQRVFLGKNQFVQKGQLDM